MCKRHRVTILLLPLKISFMALKPKTFRTTDDVIEALKNRVNAANGGISESDVINNALRCYLGLTNTTQCQTYDKEVDKINLQIRKLIELNNLKFE